MTPKDVQIEMILNNANTAVIRYMAKRYLECMVPEYLDEIYQEIVKEIEE